MGALAPAACTRMTMRPEDNRPARVTGAWPNALLLATIVAVAVVAYWVWRDGFSGGDLLGGLLIWAGILG